MLEKNKPTTIGGLVLIACLALFCEAPVSTKSTNPGSPDGDTDTDSDTGTGDPGGTDGDTDSYTDDDLDGCAGIDFLFVIDNSGSMGDEQSNLISSFSGFIDTIINATDVDDFHVLVIDSDADAGSANTSIISQCPADPCCVDFCTNSCAPSDVWIAECTQADVGISQSCGAWLGMTPPSTGDVLGCGHTGGNNNIDCAPAGGNRFLLEQEPDLAGAFSCVADVGINGSGNEKVMEAMTRAVGPLNHAGACNAGFIREEAILVVTFITDEDDIASTGDPAAWRQTLLDAKGGLEEGVVVLGVFGDNDQPGGICDEYDPSSGDGAAAAPVLRTFLDSFHEQGHFCSVCLADYSDCFLDAVSTIDLSCEEWVIE